MLKVTPLQCRRARGLLGWNHRDLSHKSEVQPHRINSFERGLIHLRHDENKCLYEALKEEGIVFQEYGEVALDKAMAGKKDRRELEVHHLHQRNDAERTFINEEEYRRLTGIEALSRQQRHSIMNTRIKADSYA